MYVKRKHIVLIVGVLISTLVFAFLPLKILTVTGSSMEPQISSSDLIIVAPSEYKTGDIITYKHEIEGKEYLFTHRIAEINGDAIKTKGDALKNADDYVVNKEDVVGEVIFIVPFLGSFLHFSSSFVGWISFIVIPSAILVAMEAIRVWRK